MTYRLRHIVLFFVIASPVCAQLAQNWSLAFSSASHAIGVNPLNRSIVYIYNTSDSKFYVSYDYGLSWIPRGILNAGGDIRNITVNPLDTNVVIAVGFGIFKSNDGGKTWREALANVTIDGESIDYNYLHPDTMYFVDFSMRKFYLSADTGSSWVERSTVGFGPICTVVSHPQNPNIIIIGSGDTRIERSTDMGLTWQLVKQGNPYFSEIPKMAWDKSDPNFIYGSTYVDNQYSFFRSTNGGLTWEDAGIYGMYTWGLDYGIDRGDVFIGTFGYDGADRGIYRSVDRGQSFMKVGTANLGDTFLNTWMIKTAADGNVFFVNENKVYRTQFGVEGKVTGVVRTQNNTPLRFASIFVDETGDSLFIGNINGNYTLALPPGQYTLRARVAGVESTPVQVTITADNTITQDFQVPISETFHTVSGTVTAIDGEPINVNIQLHGRYGNGSRFTKETSTTSAFSFTNLSSLSLYDSIVVIPQELPYITSIIKPLTLDASVPVSIDIADVLIVSETYVPSGAYLEYYTNRLNEAGYKATGLEGYSLSSIPEHALLKTKYKTALWLTRRIEMDMDPLWHDTLVSFIQKGGHVMIAGQDILEKNSSLPVFSEYLKLGFGGNYTTDPTIQGIDGNLIGNGLNFSISQSTLPSRDRISFSNANASVAFRYGTLPEDADKYAGVYISNTGFGGKAVVLGFDPYRVGDLALRTIFDRTLKYFNGEEGAFDLTVSVFQNSLIRNRGSIVIAATHILQIPPIVKIAKGTDTTQVTVTALSGAKVYSGAFNLSEGSYKLITRGVSHKGPDSTKLRSFNVSLLKPQTEALITVPDASATLAIEKQNFSGYVMATTEDQGAEKIFHFGTPDMTALARIAIKVPGISVETAEKTLIYRQEGNEWKWVPTVFVPGQDVLEASVERFGTYKTVYDPQTSASTEILRSFELKQNYPNPFNPTTTITYDIPSTMKVSLVVYNILGQKIKTLWDGVRTAGRYTQIWNGRNEKGQLVTSGVYLYQIKAGNKTSVKRMLLIK
ncbi:MAG TPA: carboxypeptidase-like regulatory domain-containing protein [bacterium]|nr:carboxypeptidase-like regulatory domain-containing protein [bacterium]